ncbi:MAG: hypothetical protein OEU68_15820 [Nitrospira sp.]|nr:hypothetical protein [Nitrospira sp.]MDH4245263.1 hypothetical protein [Nitrospira sp.]MDH4357598.1 hypothetical protein [Nitrospira sp.]MDH5318813.1 hypothetical protein [Nitrospira sp.]
MRNLIATQLVPTIWMSTRMVLTRWPALLMMLLTVWLQPSPGVAQEISVPGLSPLAETQEIELIYAGTQSVPKIIVRGRQPTNSFPVSSYRPAHDHHVDLLSLTDAGQPVGVCRVRQERVRPLLQLHFDQIRTSPCGFVWSVQSANTSLDILSFQALRMRGTTTRLVTIELVEAPVDQRKTTTVVDRVLGPFDVEIPLAPLARRIDLRRLAQIKLSVEADAEVVLQENVLLPHKSTNSPPPAVGFWYWDYRAAIRDPEGMVAVCRQLQCRRLLLQLPDLRDSDQVWADYATLFAQTKAAGIELYALDGAPDMIDHPTVVTDKLSRLLRLVGGGIPGLQLDIEPYLLDDFPEDETIFDRYLRTIELVREALSGHGRLSVVIPFWFASTIHLGRSMAFSVMDRADDVSVMSYRTDVDELVAISDDILRYGVLTGVPVWLGMETTRLLPERHMLLKREPDPALADGTLDPARRMLTLGRPTESEKHGVDQIWLRIHHHTTVRPERISFAGRPQHEVRHAITQVLDQVRLPSFSGLLIHDLPGYLELTQ